MADKKGINNNNLKQENRGLILKKIVTGESNTRIELAKKSGLSKMSVSNIIGEFIKQGIVIETETEPVGGQGRKPITLSIPERAPKVIGLDIHRTECVAVLSDLELNVIKMARVPLTQENSGDFFPIIFGVIDEVIADIPHDEIIGIGVGASGPVDLVRGMILNSPDFYGLHDLQITKTLQKYYQLPVRMDSQYNCAALAEKYYGQGRSFHDFIFIGIMKGIGSGVIADDQILRHANGFTSEIGHVSIDWQGNSCDCGSKGCLETYAGSVVVQQRLVAATGLNLSFRQFCQLAETMNNPQIEAVFLDVIEKVACGLTSTVNLLNPEAIIIGHEGYFIPERYLKMLEERINQRKLTGPYHHIQVLKSFFRNEAHILGSSCTILDQVFAGELNFY